MVDFLLTLTGKVRSSGRRPRPWHVAAQLLSQDKGWVAPMKESLFLVGGVRSLSLFFFLLDFAFLFVCFLCFFVVVVVLTLFFTSLLSYWEGKLSALCPWE